MKLWNFNVKNNPREVSNKLESALKPVGFVFNVNRDENNSITFKVRKRFLYAWYAVFQNWTIINGKLLKTNTENKTDVEISFSQHFLVKLIVFAHLFVILGLLIAIIAGINSSPLMYIFGGIILALGIILWIGVRQKFEKDVQKYKTLISEILES